MCGTRVGLVILSILFLTGFQLAPVRWPSPVVITLRWHDAGMLPGMRARAEDAARMWQSERLTIRIVDEAFAGPDTGKVLLGSTNGLGRMGAYIWTGKTSLHMRACAILVNQTSLEAPVSQWHTGIEPPPSHLFDAMTDFAHELGHCIGLTHEESASPPALMRPLIHSGEYHRALTPDDVAGREALFPPTPRRAGIFGCTRR